MYLISEHVRLLIPQKDPGLCALISQYIKNHGHGRGQPGKPLGWPRSMIIKIFFKITGPSSPEFQILIHTLIFKYLALGLPLYHNASRNVETKKHRTYLSMYAHNVRATL